MLEQANFQGINRKVQLKPTRWGMPPSAWLPQMHPTSSQDLGSGGEQAGKEGRELKAPAAAAEGSTTATATAPGPSASSAATSTAGAAGAGKEKDKDGKGRSEGGGGEGGPGQQQPAPRASLSLTPAMPQLEEALMVVKWGGVLTHAGRQQAEDLGKVFRWVMGHLAGLRVLPGRATGCPSL